nr:hypothetical protein BaRGS_033963 [Batillaria attramentaria]
MTDLASCLNEVSKVKEEGSGKGEVCLPCSKQMQYPKEAEQFCLDCSQPYCETCLQVHMTIPSCQTHSIVAIDDHTAREVHQKHHQQCSEHPEECSKMNSVTTMASARRLHLETAQRDLLQSLQQAREMQKKLKKEKEDLAKQSSSSLRDVDEAYEALVTKVKDQKQNDLLKMREAMNAVHKHLTGHEEDINAYVSLLEEDVTKLQSRQLIVSDTQLLREVKLCDCKEAESAATDVSTYVDKISRCQYSLPSLNKAKLEELHKTLGKMTLTFGGPDSQAAGAQCANLAAGDLRRPIISDFAVLPNDRLALIDRANNRLKLVQLNGESQDGQFPSVDLNKPHGVCHMTGDVVAVVSHVNKTLQLVSLQGPQPGVQHTHNTCRGYLNIARLTPDILAARFSLGVHVLDVGGPALRLKAAIVNDNNGKPLFQSPMSMCTTSDGKIVILDGMLLEISCWDRSGVPIWRVVHSNLHFPRSLCTVGLRRLYCMCNTTRLDCLTTSTGKLLHSVKLDTKEAPLKEVSSIAQDSQGRILVNTSEEIVCFTWI